MAEKFGVDGRGGFYESGAIRDVIQNHLLQVVGFLAMEPPTKINHQSMRDEQVKVFRKIRPLICTFRWTICPGGGPMPVTTTPST
jgi:glucose-6-phosphate 1-dehydrogenase